MKNQVCSVSTSESLIGFLTWKRKLKTKGEELEKELAIAYKEKMFHEASLQLLNKWHWLKISNLLNRELQTEKEAKDNIEKQSAQSLQILNKYVYLHQH